MDLILELLSSILNEHYRSRVKTHRYDRKYVRRPTVLVVVVVPVVLARRPAWKDASLEYLRCGFRYLAEYWWQAVCIVVAEDSVCIMDGNRSLGGSLRVRTGCFGGEGGGGGGCEGGGGGGNDETKGAPEDARSAIRLKFRSGHSLGEVATMREGESVLYGGTAFKPKNNSSSPGFHLPSRVGDAASPSLISPRPRFDCHLAVDGLFESIGTTGALRPRTCDPLTLDTATDLENCCAPPPPLRPRSNTTDFTTGLDGYVVGRSHLRSKMLSSSRNSSPINSSQRMKLRNGDGIRYLIQSTCRSSIYDDVTEESFRCTNHSAHMMHKMELYFSKRQLCDVMLVAGSRKIAAHRVMLSAASDYFFAMFTSNVREATQEEILMKDVDSDALAALIKYIYTGFIDLCDETVEGLMATACLLQLDEVVEACSGFLMKQLHPSNCIGIRQFADAQGCRELYRAANEYVVENFVEVMHNQEFLLMSADDLCPVLASDDINVSNEETVFQAVMTWAVHDPGRTTHLAKLLAHVRLPLIPPQFIADHVAANALLKEDRECQELIMDALKYHLLPERRSALQSSRTRPRKSTVGFLYAVGGMDCMKGAISIEKYDLRSNEWTQVANMNGRRLQFGIAVLDNLLYVVGGRDGLKTLSTVECFDPRKRVWTMMSPMSTRRHGLGVGVLEGPMYAVGGHDGWSYLNTVERWDPQAKQWSFVAPLSTARSTVGVVVIGFKLYAVGGRDGSSCLRSVECFDPHTNKWSLCSPMSKRRGGVGVAVCNGFLYAVGGHDAPASNPTSSRFDCVERYDCKTDTWTTVAPICSPRDAVGVCVLGDRLYAVGGYDGQQYLNEVEAYDAHNNEWTKVAPLCIGRAGACVVHLQSSKQ